MSRPTRDSKEVGQMAPVEKARRASVVVLAWQDHELTRRCVESLAGQVAQIVIVDNGSGDPHRDELAALSKEYGTTFVRSDENLGFAGGMNIGLARVTEEVVIFSNNDLTVVDGAIEKLVAALDSPSVGAAFSTTMNEFGEVSTAAGSFLTVGRAMAHAIGLDFLMPRLGIEAPPERCDWLTGPFVAMRTELAKSIGGVPAQSFFYAEDYRLCWTIRQLGLEKRLVSDAVVIHVDDASANKVWDSAGIAQNQTRELVRAAVDQYKSKLARWLLGRSYYFGCRWRQALRPSPLRHGCVIGARQALS